MKVIDSLSSNLKTLFMKELHSLSLTRLTHLEFGQYIKSTTRGITLLNSVVDVDLKNYLSQLNLSNAEFDKGLLQVQKSDETAKIVAADHNRDIAISTLLRYLSVFEWSEIESEVEAHDSLQTLTKTYKGIQSWNFEEESNGVDKLISDLNNDKYSPSVKLLGMNDFVTRVTKSNEVFKTVFEGRTQEVVFKEVYDMKKLRASTKIIYEDMAGYIFSMAKTKNTEEFNKSLTVVNTVRKYYADLLAKRKPATATAPLVAIPPMV
jgi:Family of unknown function (DUF6261)